MGIDAQWNARSGLLPEHPQDLLRRSSVHPDARGGLQRLGVGIPAAVTDDAQVKFHRSRVRVDLDDGHLVVIVAGVLVESDQPGLVRLDEAGQPGDSLLFGVKRAFLEPAGGDEDERSGYKASSFRPATACRGPMLTACR